MEKQLSRVDRFGLSAALTMPFDAEMHVDVIKPSSMRALPAEWLHSVTLFGTTGEGSSIGDDERADCSQGIP